jgi:hypothetical protein
MFLEPLAGHRDAHQSEIGNRPLQLANHRRSVVDNVLKRQQADRFQRPPLNCSRPKLLVESFIPSAERVTGREVPLAITYVIYALTYAQKVRPWIMSDWGR